ncbi:MAG TPA: putative cytokinetic ring protein SteA [Mycobacteriales bacterium]|nr:putative cytokinetic ring protein SteA [Mycobacteriales bacterium]
MRLATQRRRKIDNELPGIGGPARVGRRAAQLLPRLKPGDIAVLDQVDLDRATAEALVDAGVAGVVDASPVISGRYPNLGPEILAAAGIPVLDDVGTEVFGALRDGTRVRLAGDTLYAGETVLARGAAQTPQTITDRLLAAKAGLTAQLEAFAANTVEFAKRERPLLLDGAGVPQLRTRIGGRQVVVVSRGYDYRRELAGLRDYLREVRPVLIGVDGGADALREAGYLPDLVVGRLDAVSDEVLRSGAEVVVHADAGGRAPGLARVLDLGVDAITFPAAGTSEDIALLLAHRHGAALIVAVGTRATLLELLDRDRGGMASTFLTRLTVGPTLVDAQAVIRLHRSRISGRALLLLAVAALVVVGVLAAVTPAGRLYLAVLSGWWEHTVGWARDRFR